MHKCYIFLFTVLVQPFVHLTLCDLDSYNRGRASKVGAVCIYNGAGSSPESVKLIKNEFSRFKELKQLKMPIQEIPAKLLTGKSEGAFKKCGVIIMPNGNDKAFAKAINIGVALKRFRNFVETGGTFFGIGAGAAFASSVLLYDVNGKHQILQKRAALSYTPSLGPLFGNAPTPDAMVVNLILSPVLKHFETTDNEHALLHGGSLFLEKNTLETSIVENDKDLKKLFAAKNIMAASDSTDGFNIEVLAEYDLTDEQSAQTLLGKPMPVPKAKQKKQKKSKNKKSRVASDSEESGFESSCIEDMKVIEVAVTGRTNKAAAIIQGQLGRGIVILSAVSPEYKLNDIMYDNVKDVDENSITKIHDQVEIGLKNGGIGDKRFIHYGSYILDSIMELIFEGYT